MRILNKNLLTLVSGFTVRQQVMLSESELIRWQVSSEGLSLANVVLNKKHVGLLA
jgi:hypothetical protein